MHVALQVRTPQDDRRVLASDLKATRTYHIARLCTIAFTLALFPTLALEHSFLRHSVSCSWRSDRDFKYPPPYMVHRLFSVAVGALGQVCHP